MLVYSFASLSKHPCTKSFIHLHIHYPFIHPLLHSFILINLSILTFLPSIHPSRLPSFISFLTSFIILVRTQSFISSLFANNTHNHENTRPFIFFRSIVHGLIHSCIHSFIRSFIKFHPSIYSIHSIH